LARAGRKRHAEGALEAINKIAQVCCDLSGQPIDGLWAMDQLWDIIPEFIPDFDASECNNDTVLENLTDLFTTPWFSKL
jgi:hypothetical protein